MTQRHAEIIGGGLAGLTAAIALAQRGWSVRVHERHNSLRREGFGITIHANGLRVLAAVGAYDDAVRDGVQLGFSELRDARNTVIARAPMDARGYRVSRVRLLSALESQAKRAGVDIQYGSAARTAAPDGTVELADGRRLPADLVVAADGVNSPLRDSLGLVHTQTVLADGAQRLIVPSQPGDAEHAPNTVIEWWNGTRRIVYGACSSSEIYIALSCRGNDAPARQVPIDVAAWTRSFPFLAELLVRVHRDTDWPNVLWAPFMQIKLRRWSVGNVAVIGDAAHAMPPNLGQGGSCAMMGGLSLAVHLDGAGEIPAALRRWETRERPLIEHTQRWSRLYSILAGWPRMFSAPVLSLLTLRRFRVQYRRTASHIPTGTESLAAPG
jgi:2-polyprenyl-6-methoxyphenol hydroxylase-like FAD-dependent oxidoreductase